MLPPKDTHFLFSSLFPPLRLVVKPEVQALVALILGRVDVVLALGGCPGVPDFVTAAVDPAVVKVHRKIQEDDADVNADQGAVAPAVARRIVGAVDVGVDDTAGLAAHVVHGSRNSAGADSIGVARGPADLDGVVGGVGEQQADNGKDDPLVLGGGVDAVERDEARQRPELADEAVEGQAA